jgi:hypothetical protein
MAIKLEKVQNAIGEAARDKNLQETLMTVITKYL